MIEYYKSSFILMNHVQVFTDSTSQTIDLLSVFVIFLSYFAFNFSRFCVKLSSMLVFGILSVSFCLFLFEFFVECFERSSVSITHVIYFMCCNCLPFIHILIFAILTEAICIKFFFKRVIF